MGLDYGKHQNVARSGLLICFHRDPACKFYSGSIFFIGWSFDFSVGSIQGQGEGDLERSGVLYGQNMAVILGECHDNFGSYLQWKKYESKKGFRI